MPWGLRQKSKKREDEEAKRREVRRLVFDRDRGCVGRDLAPWIRCGGPHDCHEIIPRSAWRAGYLVVDNCVRICRNHHDWIGDYPDAAHAVGLHGYSWERPDA